MLRRPRLQAPDIKFLNAFQTLNRARRYSMAGPQPIPISEILALMQLLGVDESRDRKRYAHLVQELDRVFLSHAAEKVEKAKGAQTPKP